MAQLKGVSRAMYAFGLRVGRIVVNTMVRADGSEFLLHRAAQHLLLPTESVLCILKAKRGGVWFLFLLYQLLILPGAGIPGIGPAQGLSARPVRNGDSQGLRSMSSMTILMSRKDTTATCFLSPSMKERCLIRYSGTMTCLPLSLAGSMVTAERCPLDETGVPSGLTRFLA